MLLMISIPGYAAAQTISWTGSGDGTSWNQAANWSENRVPDSQDDVAITLNGTYTVVQPSSNITINSLTLGAEAGIQTLEKSIGTFALADAELGQWNLIVSNPGGSSQTITGGFTVREHERPSIVANIMGTS